MISALRQPRMGGTSPLPLPKQHRSSKQPRFLVFPPWHGGLGLRVPHQGGMAEGLRTSTILMELGCSEPRGSPYNMQQIKSTSGLDP